MQQGWPREVESTPELLLFTRRKNELSLQDGCILCGTQVIVTLTLHAQVMGELHEAHSRVSRMKNLVGQCAWWLGPCQLSRNNPPLAVLHPWDWVHVDYAGPFMRKRFLVVTDAQSKWMDIHMVSSTTTQVMVNRMRSTFATLGLPEVLVTDNGMPFTSVEFVSSALEMVCWVITLVMVLGGVRSL